MTIITRVEVIDENGRSYVSWEDDNDVSWQFQDGGRTLKVFVNKTGALEALEEWFGPEPPQEPELSPIEQTKKDIANLQQRLKLLEYQETVRTDVEKAYRDFYGHYPIIDMSTNDYDAATWVAFKEGYKAGQKPKEYQPTPQEPEQLKTLYQMFENEGAYGQIYFDDALKVVKSWMSQYADNVMCGEYKKGYEECLTINLTLKELETLDKYLELNDKTRPLFDKIRNAYPKPTTLFDVRGRGKCLI